MKKILDYLKQWLKYWRYEIRSLVLLHINEGELSCFLLEKMEVGWKVVNYSKQQAKLEDPLFFQEALYVFLEGLKVKVPVILCFSQYYLVEESFIYPPDLKHKELLNSLTWDLKSLSPAYSYAYKIVHREKGIEVKVKGLSKEMYSKWESWLADNKGISLDVVAEEMDCIKAIKLKMAKGLILEADKPWLEIIDNAVRGEFSFKDKNTKPSSYAWRKIFKHLLVVIITITGLLLGYWQINVMNLRKQVNESKANIGIYTAQVKENQGLVKSLTEIRQKQQIIAILTKQQSGFYGLIQALASANVTGVMLTKIQVEKTKFSIQGESENYSLLNEYRGKLRGLNVVKEENLIGAERLAKKNKVHFLIEGVTP